MAIALEDADAEIAPIPISTDVGIPVPELDLLSHILATFHDLFGDIEWTDEDKVKKQVSELPDIVKNDERYQNAMRNSDEQNARVESERATVEAILATMSSGVELFKFFNSNQSLRKWILDMVFNSTYEPGGGGTPAETAVWKPRK